MAISNNQVAKTNKPKFSVAIQSDAYKNLINNTLRDPNRASRFIANISSAVAVNPALQECDAGTILSGALLGESLQLSPSPQLGQFYLVPFKDNKNNRVVAQFQLGYKGYIQLAVRSGMYKKIDVSSVKEGELVDYNPITKEIKLNPIRDLKVRKNTPTIGYYAWFEYTTGFVKELYWTKEEMEDHALEYSKGYQAKKGYTFWEKDFDGMAYKTMLRQLISKWGIMSIEMQEAFNKDMSAIHEDGKIDYVDNSNGFEAIPTTKVEETVTADNLVEEQKKPTEVVDELEDF